MCSLDSGMGHVLCDEPRVRVENKTCSKSPTNKHFFLAFKYSNHFAGCADATYLNIEVRFDCGLGSLFLSVSCPRGHVLRKRGRGH